MLRRQFLAGAGAVAAGLAQAQPLPRAVFNPAKAQPMAVTGRYARVNGLELYYEIHGGGAPLILLHGGLGTIDEIFQRLIPALAAGRQVIAVELQGHGHTADPGRAMSYEAMADDIAALVDYLNLGQVDIAGYSVGGGVALQMAVRHPRKVRKLVVISAPFASGGWYPEIVEGTGAMDPVQMTGSRWHQAFLRAGRRPEDWSGLVRNVAQLMSSRYDWRGQVGAISAPMLVIVGDADSVKPEHAVELFRLRGGARRDGFVGGRPASQLCVVPSTHHLDILDRTDVLGPVILDFLRRGMEDAGPAY